MPVRRKLTLNRDVLDELTTDELRGVAGAAPDYPTQDRPTGYSCLDYVSCYQTQCLPKTLVCPE